MASEENIFDMNTDSSISDSERETEMLNENDEISEYVLSHNESMTDDEAVLKHYKKMKSRKFKTFLKFLL